MRKTSLIAMAAVMASAVSVPALADSTGLKNRFMNTAKSQTEGQIYVKVNRAFFFVDDGVNDFSYHADNKNSSSRFGFKGKAKFGDGMWAALRMEYEVSASRSDQASQTNLDPEARTDFTERLGYIELGSKKYGKIQFGQIKTASDEKGEINVSGTKLTGFQKTQDDIGDFEFINATTQATTGRDIDSVIANYDGNSRRDGIKYETPSFNGFVLGASHARDGGGGATERSDVAISYKGEIRGAKVKAAAYYAEQNRNDITGGSIGIVLPGGINFSGTYEEADINGSTRDPKFYYANLGYQTKALSSLGKTSFSIDYGKNEERAAANEEGDFWGIGFTQKVKEAGLEIYAGWREYDADIPGTPTEEIGRGLIGARLQI